MFDALIPCPVCLGTARNPEAPAAIADDDGTCLACCDPTRPGYAARPGHAAQVYDGSAAHVLGTMTDLRPDLVPCPACRGTGRNPKAPAAIADDDGTCLVCCYPLHPWYIAWHGQIRVPVAVLVVQAAEAELAELDLSGDDASR
ncbi:hypothetical protein [Nannocystis pusilla]|uniref:hypothetical protein n=1 Tax=Nannocystis pusilla TaxID=889268 RepID=UPI003B760C43